MASIFSPYRQTTHGPGDDVEHDPGPDMAAIRNMEKIAADLYDARSRLHAYAQDRLLGNDETILGWLRSISEMESWCEEVLQGMRAE